jgi:glutathione S-transferase
MKLYYVPKTRSTRPRWLLEELGVPYEVVRLDPTKGETRNEAHLKRNPLGHVPVLENDDGSLLFESAAIVLHLADQHGRFLPPVGTAERGLAYQWVMMAMTEMEPHCATFFAEKVGKKTPESEPALKAKVKINEGGKVLDAALQGREFLLPSGFSAADIVVGSVALWAQRMGCIEPLPNLMGYLERLAARPAYQRAVRD